MERLQEYVRSSTAQVRGLVRQKNDPTDLQLHRYVCELVRVLSEITAGAPAGLQREVRRPFEGFWDFQRNVALHETKLRVHHLTYVLEQLEGLLLTGREVFGEVAVREISHDARQLLAKTPFAQLKQDLLQPSGVLIRGVRVRFSFALDPKLSHHTCSWSFQHSGREVSESVLYWDEHFVYGRSTGESDDDDDDMDLESLDTLGDGDSLGQGDDADGVGGGAQMADG